MKIQYAAMFVSLILAGSASQAGMMVDVEEMDQYLENVAAANPGADLDTCTVGLSDVQESTQGATNFASEEGYLALDCSDAAKVVVAKSSGGCGFFKRLFGGCKDFRSNIDRKHRKNRVRLKPQGCRVGR